MFKIISGNDHVADSNTARQEQGAHIIDQARILDHKVSRDQTASEIHGDDKENTEKFSSRHIPVAERISGQIDHGH